MIFSINRAEAIKWPNKCVWCRKEPTMTYIIYGIGIIGDERILAEWNKLEITKVNYPVCQKHWWWSMGTRAAYLVSFLGILFSWIIHPALPSIFVGMFVLVIRLQPVKIKGVTEHLYNIVIRRDDYGREFALLNGLDPYAKGRGLNGSL